MRIEVYVPGTRDVDKPLTASEQEQLAKRVAAEFSQLFGGATILHGAVGFYLDNDTEIQEPIMIVYSFVNQLSKEQRESIVQMVTDIKREYGQREMLITIDNEPLLI